MGDQASWRRIVASALDWDQAHATLDASLAKLPSDLRGKQPSGLRHTIWELLDHIRRTQRDLLDFMTKDDYHEPKWPDDYWPSSAEPESDSAWDACVETIHTDAAAIAAFTMDESRDLTAKIPHGTGQTYLRTVLVAIDHLSHHVGQIIDARRILGAWPPA